MIQILVNVRSNKKEVAEFLGKLNDILLNEKFDVEKDITIIKSKKKEAQYSTPYTLLDLDYDTDDVVERLKELRVEEYSETKIDKDDLNPPLLYVFGKNIDGKQVYIKLKIKENKQKHILCVSFHYAEREMNFPYI